jgi:GTPase
MPLPRIAIVGATNVGKSTLFNRLVGSRRSLVADEPGLTRDLIEASLQLADRSAVLVDTGGLMPPESAPLATEIRRRVLDAARQSDLLLFVVDGRKGLTPLDEDLSRIFRESGRPCLLVVNKIDGGEEWPAEAEFARLGFSPEHVLAISAEHALGITDLKRAIASRLPTAGATEETPPEIQVAIAGRPNVGKSSLLNALLRSDRALVAETPGTTRDSVDAVLTRQGRRYRIVDTAGMRRAGRIERGAESLSVHAARRSVRDAGVTLVLLDASEGLVAQDLHVLGLVAGGQGDWVRPAVLVLNKVDLLSSREAITRLVETVRERVKFARFAPVIPVSALKRWHLDRIFSAIDDVAAESTRTLKTGELNDWLREATTRHRPPLHGGKPFSLVFVSQASSRPATFTILTNRAARPHFSYARYLENSLRDRFSLHLTPVILRFRPRRREPRGAN